MPASAAKFGDVLANTYGIVSDDDLFAPPSEDSRYITKVEGCFGAQREWLANNLPERGTLLTVDDYGRGQLPKKAEQVHGTPGKAGVIGHYVDRRTGEIETVVYRLQDAKEAGKSAGGTKDAADGAENTPAARIRRDVTQKGVAMIGDLRTDALHQALAGSPIEDETLLGMLILAFSGDNVTVDTGNDLRGDGRQPICRTITEGGALTGDLGLLRQAARRSDGRTARRAGRSPGSRKSRLAAPCGRRTWPPKSCCLVWPRRPHCRGHHSRRAGSWHRARMRERRQARAAACSRHGERARTRSSCAVCLPRLCH
jgi:hypothetical protein